MRGKHRIIVQNKRIRYDFEITRNITILKGDSATGKTTLIEMIQEYMDQGEESMVELKCDKKCGVISGSTWEGQLSEFSGSIIFIDEGNSFILTDHFADVIKSTDNYYVIVSREGLPNLPYSIEEIYGIRVSGKYGQLKQCHQEFYHIYNIQDVHGNVSPQRLIVEDSNSGYQFFENICRALKIQCASANGKSNIIGGLKKVAGNEETLVIADGAAFGSEIDKVLKYVKSRSNIKLYLPESFEWIILSSGVAKNGDIPTILENPYDYIDSEKYFSWERYFTQLLVEITNETPLKYSKRKINPAYLQERVKERIMAVMEGIEFNGTLE